VHLPGVYFMGDCWAGWQVMGGLEHVRNVKGLMYNKSICLAFFRLSIIGGMGVGKDSM